MATYGKTTENNLNLFEVKIITIIILFCGGSITANKNLVHDSEQKLSRAVNCLGSFAGLFPSSAQNYL